MAETISTTTEVETPEITESVEQTTTADQTATGLTIQDLTLTLQVVNLAASRGAFKGEEMSAVGGLHDRIFKFLESVGAITRTDPNASTAEETTESEPVEE